MARIERSKNMLELKRIRENRAAVEEGLKKRGKSYNLDRLLAADDERKALLSMTSSDSSCGSSRQMSSTLTKSTPQSA